MLKFAEGMSPNMRGLTFTLAPAALAAADSALDIAHIVESIALSRYNSRVERLVAMDADFLDAVGYIGPSLTLRHGGVALTFRRAFSYFSVRDVLNCVVTLEVCANASTTLGSFLGAWKRSDGSYEIMWEADGPPPDTRTITTLGSSSPPIPSTVC